jgi:hypothetical protein
MLETSYNGPGGLFWTADVNQFDPVWRSGFAFFDCLGLRKTFRRRSMTRWHCKETFWRCTADLLLIVRSFESFAAGNGLAGLSLW